MNTDNSSSKANLQNNDSFEAKYNQLQSIVNYLESGPKTLDQSMKKFKEGAKLKNELTHALKNASQTYAKIVNQAGQEEAYTRDVNGQDTNNNVTPQNSQNQNQSQSPNQNQAQNQSQTGTGYIPNPNQSPINQTEEYGPSNQTNNNQQNNQQGQLNLALGRPANGKQGQQNSNQSNSNNNNGPTVPF